MVSQELMIAGGVIAVVLILIFLLRKDPKVARDAARFKRAEKEKNLAVFTQTWRTVFLVIVFSVIMLQSLIYVLAETFSINFVGLGFAIKGIILFLLIMVVFNLVTRSFKVDTVVKLFMILLILGLLIAALFGIEKVIPQLFSSQNIFSVGEMFI